MINNTYRLGSQAAAKVKKISPGWVKSAPAAAMRALHAAVTIPEQPSSGGILILSLTLMSALSERNLLMSASPFLRLPPSALYCRRHFWHSPVPRFDRISVPMST